MSELPQVSDNLLMTTRRNDHDCTFTWRLRNLSLLTSTGASVLQEFTLHPECDRKWRLKATAAARGISLDLDPVVGGVGTRMALESYLGVYLNPKGDEFVQKNTFTHRSLDFYLVSKEGKIRTWCGKAVELEDDTLVVKGRMIVPSCCPNTEVQKEEAAEPLDLCKLMEEELVVA